MSATRRSSEMFPVYYGTLIAVPARPIDVVHDQQTGAVFVVAEYAHDTENGYHQVTCVALGGSVPDDARYVGAAFDDRGRPFAVYANP